MDSVLARIASEGSDREFLHRILEELESSFGEELRFGNGHVYREVSGEYELMHTAGIGGIFPERLSIADPAVQLVVSHGAYVFETSTELPLWYKPQDDCENEFVAFQIDGSPGFRYLFMFSLRQGWSRDELAFCLNGVRFSMNNRLKAEAAQSELDTAATIQRSLIPDELPSFHGYDIAARSQPAEEVGGDLYDFILLDEDLMGIVVGDASGHGLPAALMVRDVLMGIRMGVGTNLKMLYTMKKLNRVLHKTTFSTRFISVFYCELGRSGGILYTNAGHTPGLILTDEDIIRMDPTGPILGPLPDIPLERAHADIPAGGIMVLYTDGITERIESDGSPFDEKGLIGCIRKCADLSASEIVDRVFDYALSLPHESDLLEDDATLLIIKRNR